MFLPRGQGRLIPDVLFVFCGLQQSESLSLSVGGNYPQYPV